MICTATSSLIGQSEKEALAYVRPLSSNNPGRGACAALLHSDPEADGFADQLQHRAESESTRMKIILSPADVLPSLLFAPTPKVAQRVLEFFTTQSRIRAAALIVSQVSLVNLYLRS